MEIVRRNTGDAINIFLRVENSAWYYFNYMGGIMQAISSNQQFNEAIISTKDKQRKLKKEKVEEGPNLEAYQYIISTPNKMASFVEKMSTISEY